MLNKIEKLQNRTTRVLTYSNYDADGGHSFEFLGWKNLAFQQQIQRAKMVYSSLHGLAPDYLCSKFERRETAYNLRDSENKLHVPLTCVGEHSDRHIGRDIGRYVGRHVDRHISRESVDMSIDTSAESRSICRPTYRSSIGRYVDRQSTDMSVDMSTDIS